MKKFFIDTKANQVPSIKQHVMTKEKFKDGPMFKSLLINFIDINKLKKKKSHDFLHLNKGRRNNLLRTKVHFL